MGKVHIHRTYYPGVRDGLQGSPARDGGAGGTTLVRRFFPSRTRVPRTRIRIALLVLESIAKTVLILVGLWIAFSRAVAAARAASDFCFSHFFWTFLETVGFECCCTIVLLFPGVLFVLLAQDRLKHLLITGTDRVAAAPLTSTDAPKEAAAKPSIPEKVEGQS